MADKNDSSASTENFRDAHAEAHIDDLEKGYVVGLCALTKLHGGLQKIDMKRKQLEPLLEKIEKCRQISLKEVYVAVSGGSGSGKSKLLSAILDQEEVVPSGCAGACTGAVCDIAYNERASEYYVEVVLHTHESLKDEFQAVYDDELDRRDARIRANTKRSKSTDPEDDRDHDDDTAADVGIAKIKALFPWWKRSSIDEVTVDDLLNDERLHILGTTQVIETDDKEEYIRRLTGWITSTETSDGDNTAMRRPLDYDLPPQRMSYWPIVNVVKIFLKSPILKHGLHLIDLPGFQDCNAARRKVTRDYIKCCSEMILVSDISRATTDQSLEEHITASFKTQCQLDGTLSALTIVCTKSDLCNAIEVKRQMPQTTELKTISSKLTTARDALDSCNENNGASIPNRFNKRKRESEDISPYDRILTYHHDIQPRLTTWELPGVTYSDKKDAERLVGQIQDLEYQEKAECIAIRNSHVKRDMRARFKDILDDMFYEDGEDPEDVKERQKHQELMSEAARSLKVLTVSALAYQQLNNRHREYERTTGFASPDFTEIPMLQMHCKQLAIAHRKPVYFDFLMALYQLYQTSEFQLENTDASIIGQSLSSCLRKLLRDAMETFEFLFRGRYRTLKSCLEKRFQANISAPIRDRKREYIVAAQLVIQKWGGSPREGGVNFQTYRALCRRHGVFTNRRNVFTDWNEELATTMMSRTATGWSLIFGQLVPETVNSWISECNNFIETFETDVRKHLARFGHLPKQVELLCREVRNKKSQIKRTAAYLLDKLSRQQKDLNRELAPKIQIRMAPAYHASASECGDGMFNRMKNHTCKHSQRSSERLFGAPMEQLQKDAFRLIEDLFVLLGEETRIVLDAMKDDIENAIKLKSQATYDHKQDLKRVISDFAKDFKGIEDLLQTSGNTGALN